MDLGLFEGTSFSKVSHWDSFAPVLGTVFGGFIVLVVGWLLHWSFVNLATVLVVWLAVLVLVGYRAWVKHRSAENNLLGVVAGQTAGGLLQWGNPPDLPAKLFLATDIISLVTEEYHADVKPCDITILDTIQDHSGRIGISLWKGTRFPYTRLIDFVATEPHNPSLAKEICTVFQQHFRPVKIMDSQKILSVYAEPETV